VAIRAALVLISVGGGSPLACDYMDRTACGHKRLRASARDNGERLQLKRRQETIQRQDYGALHDAYSEIEIEGILSLLSAIDR
jgi:hypothetical protein